MAQEVEPTVGRLVITGSSNPGLRDQVEGLGVHGFLQKPFTGAFLAMQVEKTIAAIEAQT